ncbi:hypothetical protein FHU14_002765 [Mesorhizobium sp. RMAD-H1]|nr:hypothetical protein [Mesorhizobium sp. RMAD-H1]
MRFIYLIPRRAALLDSAFDRSWLGRLSGNIIAVWPMKSERGPAYRCNLGVSQFGCAENRAGCRFRSGADRMAVQTQGCVFLSQVDKSGFTTIIKNELINPSRVDSQPVTEEKPLNVRHSEGPHRLRDDPNSRIACRALVPVWSTHPSMRRGFLQCSPRPGSTGPGRGVSPGWFYRRIPRCRVFASPRSVRRLRSVLPRMISGEIE